MFLSNLFSKFLIFILAVVFVLNFSVVIASNLKIYDHNLCSSTKSDQNCDEDCFFDRDLNIDEDYFQSKEIFYNVRLNISLCSSKEKIIDPNSNSPPKLILS